MAVSDTSCSVHPEGGKGDDVLETVARIGSKLASEEGGETVVVESLRELQGVHITFEALEATKIGRAVNALRKSAPSEEARQLAAALYKGWKALANERFRSSRAPPQQPGIEKGPSTPPPPPVKAKQSARPEDELETIAPTSVVVEAAPEAPPPRGVRQRGDDPQEAEELTADQHQRAGEDRASPRDGCPSYGGGPGARAGVEHSKAKRRRPQLQ
jgi:hypothetical protein